MKLFKKKGKEEILEREDGLVDYNVYVMTKNEKILYTTIAAAVIAVVGYIFYENIILTLLLMLFSLKFPALRTKQIIDKRKKDLTLQFKDWLYSVSSSMSAGRSVESAFKESLNDLQIIYPDPQTYIIQEVSLMVRRLEMNETVEDVMYEFAQRTHIEDIMNFADVLKICKRAGGNLVEVVKSTSSVIGDKIETKNEIETTITAKKFESRIMSVMPIAMVALLSLTSYDFMQPVFTTLQGHAVMTIAIVMFAAAFLIGEKIMKIEV